MLHNGQKMNKCLLIWVYFALNVSWSLNQNSETVLISDIFSRGGYRKPKITDVLWIQLILSPYYLLSYIYWYMHWIWHFTIMRNEYGDEQKEYIIRKNMKLSQGQWDVSTFITSIVLWIVFFFVSFLSK